MPQTAKAKRPERYHHGNLREALVAAAEGILAREGLGALTLRAAAREAGVSHAAPAHHFGDLKGLLTELAAVGFNRLAERVQSASRGTGAGAHSHMGRAYVAFARENRALFQLMFRSHTLDQASPRLREASIGAFTSFAGRFSSDLAGGGAKPNGVAAAAAVARAWSLVHGFAFLSIDGRLKPLLGMAEGMSEDVLLDAMLFGVSPPRPRTKAGKPG
jgi:AcrR family transcriptional regulator